MGFPIEIELKFAESRDVRVAQAIDLATNPTTGSTKEADSSDLSDLSDISSIAETGGSDRPVKLVGLSPVMLATGRWSRWIAIAGGFGYVPLAPGTAGSFAGVLFFGLLVVVGRGLGLEGPSALGFYGLVVFLVLGLGIYAAGRAEIDFGRRDDGRIVIDEVVGQLIALMPLVPLASLLPLALWLSESVVGPGAAPMANPEMSLSADLMASSSDGVLFSFEVVTGFVLFRLFDVWKPGAVGWAERRLGGGVGVMADDVVAGLYAAACLFVLHAAVFERFYSSAALIHASIHMPIHMSIHMTGVTS